MKILFITLLFFCEIILSQPIGTWPRVLSKPKQSWCSFDNHKVVDVRPSSCDYESNCNYLYPVLIEEFDNNYDLPNKWRFDYGYTKDDNGGGSTWYGDSYYDNSVWPPVVTNHNVQIGGGELTLVNIQENAVGDNGTNYRFTSGMINSLSKFRTGVFEARIKIPIADRMFPAFWLLGTKGGHYSEIDIFEFSDNDVSGGTCSNYYEHSMTIHTGASYKECSRSDKYPLNINAWHTYKLIWKDYDILILVDGIPVGYATKYYKMFSGAQPSCQFGSYYNVVDPAINYSCQQLQLAPDNLLPTIPYINWGPRPWWLPNAVSWPPPQPPQPYLANRVDEHAYFPSKNDAMSLIINNNIYAAEYKNDDFSAYAQSSMNMKIDWVKVYQPFCCGVDKTVCSLSDLDNQTYNTDILTGRKLNVGYINNSCTFEQFKPGTNGVWRDIPVVLLATDEIAIQGEAIFAGETYAEMRITNCGEGQRMGNEDDLLLAKFYDNQQKISDSLTEATKPIYDSIINNYTKMYVDSLKKEYSFVEQNDISIIPNPSSNYITINTSKWTYEKIVYLYLIDVAGKEILLEKEQKINIQNLQAGSYILKIVFDDNTFLVKKIIKI